MKTLVLRNARLCAATLALAASPASAAQAVVAPPAAASDRAAQSEAAQSGEIDGVSDILSPSMLFAPVRISRADFETQGPALGPRAARRAAREGGFASAFAPSLPFAEILDPVGQQQKQDIRDRARNYIKQQIVKEILSKTAFTRGLGKLIDTGETVTDADGIERAARSKMLPYVSPRVDAGEGKVELRLTWKF
jgi:hypothetical protein